MVFSSTKMDLSRHHRPILTAKRCRQSTLSEIYHSCVQDKNQNGPFCFLYKIIKYIEEVMSTVSQCELNRDIKRKIFDLLRSVVSETNMTNSSWLHTKHCNVGDDGGVEDYSIQTESEYLFDPVVELLQYPNSHLIYGKRWLSTMEGFLTVKTKQSHGIKKIQNFIEHFFEKSMNTDDEKDDVMMDYDSLSSVCSDLSTGDKKKRRNRMYQKEQATALSAINRVYKSYSVRFLSWWASVEAKLNNPIAMQQALSNSLRAVFGFKTSFRPGFSLATNYRFDTKQSVLSRDILKTIFDLVNDDERSTIFNSSDLEEICKAHKQYIEGCYFTTEQIDLINLVKDETFGVSKIITLKQPEIQDRTGKKQATTMFNQVSNGIKRMETEHLAQCLSQTQKFKRDESIALNSLVIFNATNKTTPSLPVSKSSLLPSIVFEGISEETMSDISDEVASDHKNNNVDNCFAQVNCYQKTTTIMMEEDLIDEETCDSFLNIQPSFMMDQSQVAIDMLRNENCYFVNQLNVLADNLGL